MSFLQHIIILFIVILINTSNSSTVTTAPTTIQSIDNEKSEKQIQVKNTDVIQLNVGGEIIMTTRETLTRVPKSILSMMFKGRWEKKLPLDKNGNIFLDFNRILFRHLLDQLQTSDSKTFSLPFDSSLVEPYKKMLRKLGFHQLLSSENNIITFNVGGQTITNQKIIFTQLSNSSSPNNISSVNTTNFDKNNNLFVDSDPKLFRHLIHQLRKQSSKTICSLEVPSKEEKFFFQRMLNELGVCHQLFSSSQTIINKKWKQNGITVAGGNGAGSELNQLDMPHDIYVNDVDQSIYISDTGNHRIVKWESHAKNGEVVAGGNERGSRTDQFAYPVCTVADKKNDSLIICDQSNSRIVRWFPQNNTNGETIISDVACLGVAIDNSGDVYVSDYKENNVKRWKIGEKKGTLVAGGNGRGKHLNQLNDPTYIFVDQDYSVYVSDFNNHRVMKWMKGAKEGIVIAGGQGRGNSSIQLDDPYGVTVDDLGNVYVADYGNNRIMRWSPGSQEGSIIVGGNKYGHQSNELYSPKAVSFDQQGNMYVVDYHNNRVQKFLVDPN